MAGLGEDLEELGKNLARLRRYKFSNGEYRVNLYLAAKAINRLAKKIKRNPDPEILYKDSELARELFYAVDDISTKLRSIGKSVYNPKGKEISIYARQKALAIREKVYGPDIVRRQIQGKEMAKKDKNHSLMSIIIILVSIFSLLLVSSAPFTGEFTYQKSVNYGSAFFILVTLIVYILIIGIFIDRGKNLRK